MRKLSYLLLVVFAIPLVMGCGNKEKKNEFQPMHMCKLLKENPSLTAKSDVNIDERLAIYTPFVLTSDISHLSANEKEIVNILFDIADIMGDLFWMQNAGPLDSLLSRIENESLAKFLKINYGPWDKLNANQSFVEQIGAKKPGANFYPADMTSAEFDSLKDENKTSLYTVIRRDIDGNLKVVWYHEIFKEKLKKASDLLNKAAALCEDETMKEYFELRAKALITDDYQPSDYAWMKMKNAKIDFVVGAIENYTDELYGYKAAFESFILIKDIEWSAKLAKFNNMLPELQKGLPCDPKYKTEMPGTKADMNVYDVVYYAGDCESGSKTIAINLPNDEQIHKEIGSRKLQLKNAMKAKFDKIVVPISKVILNPEQHKYVKFNAFFENTTFHEVAHGMGVKTVVGKEISAREALMNTYSPIEENKADITGLYLATKLHEMGELTEGEWKDNYTTFFVSMFRSIRFGTASSHGKANMMRFNDFEKMGAFTRDENGIYTINYEKMREAVNTIIADILMVQGEGDIETAKKWIAEKTTLSANLKADLDRINSSSIPIDLIFIQGRDKLDL